MTGLLKTVVPILALLTCGSCAMVQENKESNAWVKAQSALNAGIPVTQLKSCAGQPMRTIKTGDGEKWVYGVTKQMSFASAWCVLTINIDKGKTAGFSRRSNNPGGMSDGESVCAYVVSDCLGDGPLVADGGNSIVGYVTRMESEGDAADAQRSGEAARNAGLAMVAAGTPAPSYRPIQQPSTYAQAPQSQAPTKSIAQQNAENNAAYAAQIAARRPPQPSNDAQLRTGAPIQSQQPSIPAPTAQGSGQNFGQTQPSAVATFTYRSDPNVVIDYSRSDNDGSFNVYITNTGNVRLSCTVSVTGKYDSQSGMPHIGTDYIKNFSQAGQNYVTVGSTVPFRFHASGLFQIDDYRSNCSQG